MNTFDQIMDWAPKRAVMYRLSHRGADGSLRTIPEDAFLPLQTAPNSLPSGRYTILYYDIAGTHLRESNATLVYKGAPSNEQLRLDLGQASLLASGTASSSRAAGSSHAAVQQTSHQDADAEEDADSQDLDGEEESDDSFEKSLKSKSALFRLQMKQQVLQNRFLSKSQYTKEIGENLQLNGVYRRDFAEMSRILTETHRDRYAEINKAAADQSRMQEKYLERLDALMTRQQQVEARIAEVHNAQPPQPAPPPDYVSLGHSALAVLQNLLVAYMANKPANQPSLVAHSPPIGASPGVSAGMVDAAPPTPVGTESERPLAVTRVTPLSGSPVRPQMTPPSVPIVPPANPRAKEIFQEYLATLGEADAFNLFDMKNPEQLAKWINHLNKALAQDLDHKDPSQNKPGL